MLFGRQEQTTRVEALLADARSANGGALVLRGVAGSGKSTLLGQAAEVAEMHVLTTSGVESESPLAFAALQRLLWPLRSGLDRLPAPQRDALRAVMGESAAAGDRFLVFLATLSLLSDAAENRPVLVVVDDAQWLDEATAGALSFVARRVHRERLALLFAVRERSASSFDVADLPTLHLTGLDEASTGELVRAYVDDPDPSVVGQLHTVSGGNPLALIELTRALSPEQLSGHESLPAPLPLTEGVERAFLDRYHRLSTGGQRYLLVVAVDDTGSLAVIGEAARTLDIVDDAVDEAERAGLVRVLDQQVNLYHPLVRSAIYQAATSVQRRTVHAALATALAGDPDRRAWHLAAAADRPDQQVVDELHDVGTRAAARGGHGAASAAWARASELTIDPALRAELLFRAASSAWMAGQPARARTLAATASEAMTEPLTSVRLLVLRGQIEWNTRSLEDGYDFVLRAAESAVALEGPHSALGGQLAMLAASLAVFGDGSGRDADLRTLVAPPAPDAPPGQRVTHLLLQGFLAAARRDWREMASLRRALALAEEARVDDDGFVQPNLGIAALHLGDDALGIRLHTEQLVAARRAGAIDMVEHALKNGALFQVASGAWGAATAAAEEALSLAAGTGQPSLTALPKAELAVVAALRGQDDLADRRLDEVTTLLEHRHMGVTRTLVADLAHWTRGLRSVKPETALHHFQHMHGIGIPHAAAIDRIEAAVRVGRTQVAESWIADLAAFAEATGAPFAAAAAEHGRALLTDGQEAEAHFGQALEEHGRSARLADAARTRLAYGEWLRRARRRVDAREHLRAALATFEEIGAARWADRAAQELRASGESARRRDPSTARDLTAQEHQVAALVRQGLSNRDAAAQLFVSPRTVDFHLRNVFSKLGLSSRAELAALPLD